MSARPILGLVALVCIGAAALLLFFDILAGAINASPLNLVYWLQADTSGINGAPQSPTAWTLWNSCGLSEDSRTMDCGPVMAAYPFDPPSNFGTEDGVPAAFIQSRNYYYLSRVGFGLLLCAIFFTVCSLFLGLMALCTKIGGYLSSALCMLALIVQIVSAACMTAAFVMGRNAFQADGTDAMLGRYGFGFIWAPVALLFIATILFCAGARAGHEGGGGGRFGRKKNRRSVLNGDNSSFTRA